MEELRLVFFYMNYTIETVSNGDDVGVWRDAIPKEASHHLFLMDGLLALSALHFATTQIYAHTRYVGIASHYQGSALRKYTNALHSVTEDNGNALFAYAIITMILALAFTTIHEGTTCTTSTEDMITFSRLLHGIGTVNRVSRAHIRKGPFLALYDFERAEDARSELQPDVANALTELVQRAEKIAQQQYPSRRQVYLSSIEQLDRVFRRPRTSQDLRHIIAWPAVVESNLLQYLDDGDAMAQLIFLHYGVLLLRVHDRWWGRNLGLRLIEDLAASLCALGPDWDSSVKWARACAASVVASVASTIHV